MDPLFYEPSLENQLGTRIPLVMRHTPFDFQKQDMSVYLFYVHAKNNYAAINNSSKIDPVHPTRWELSPEYCNVNTSLWNAA